MSTAKSKLKGFLAGILIAVSYGALAVTYNYFSPGGALSCVAPCTSQNVDLTVSGSVNGPLRVGAGGTGTNSTLVGIVRGGSPLTSSELSGDVVTSGSNASTIQTNVVTNAKAAQMAANTLKCNNTASTANSLDCTVAQAQALLSIPNAANPSGLIGLSAVNGVATTYDRSDSVHALDQAIAPTMTGVWNFTNSITSKIAATDAFKVCPTNGNVVAGNVACGAEPSTAINGAILAVTTSTGGAQPFFGRNTSAGTAASTFIEAANNTIGREIVMGTTSTTFSGAFFAHGPSGEQKFVYSPFAAPMCFGVNNDAAMCISAANAVSINAPTAVGPSLAVLNRAGSSSALNVTANDGAGVISMAPADGSGSYALTFITDATGGKIGTNSSARDLQLQTNNVTRISMSATGPVSMPGLGTSSAATTGTVCWTTGTGLLNVDTTTTCLLSSRRFKENIRPLESALDKVTALKPVSYQLRKQFDPTHVGEQIGLIAEDVARIDTRLVSRDQDGSPRAVRYQQLTALLIKAIQEQQVQISKLQQLNGQK